MRAHEFAKQLLAGPNLEIVTPEVEEYLDGETLNLVPPVVTEEYGENEAGSATKFLIISYQS